MNTSGAQPPDDRTRVRLQRAGERFHAAENERKAAAADLKNAVIAADGGCSADEAAELTGVPTALLQVIQPELGSGTTDQSD